MAVVHPSRSTGVHRSSTCGLDEVFARYPYELSPFQKHAFQGILDGHHVLITAHTGSGKTLPAEFALEHFTQVGKKVVYTSPIKALSNQKYAEFSRKYPHISFGLLTGDIKINPDAQVLIMTTEILMNALFRSTSTGEQPDRVALDFKLNVQTDLACVVFDEIHYINDADRGHVWEKTILMLPRHIQMVMLSATIDNPERFAAWIETTKGKSVVLASTHHRVVPLTHYAFVTLPESGFKALKGDKELEKWLRSVTQDLIPLLTPEGAFQEANVNVTKKVLTTLQTHGPIASPRKFVLNQLTLFLRDRDMLPAIFFVFSRKLVETCAQEITVPVLEDDSKVSYTVARECEQILRKLPNFHEYMQMPEYRLVVSLLEKGIGIHHSGMIPILREMVELMIAKKYIKVLFATESFAIGLDCPIKTAVFTGLTKFDGQRERLLYAHEYTQMAGRAGRRGLDTVGHVVHCTNLLPPAMSVTDYRDLLSGKPQQLVSKFSISYSLVLNLFLQTRLQTSLSLGGDEPRLQTSQPPGGDEPRLQTSLSVDDCSVFANLSMRRQDLDSVYQQRFRQLEVASAERDRVEAALQQTLKMPMEECRAYLDMEERVKTYVNRRRKALERDMKLLVDKYPSCKTDVQRVHDFDGLERQVQELTAEMQHLRGHIHDRMTRVCAIMFQEGFLSLDGDKETRYSLSTPLGSMAAGLAEVHPLIMAQQMVAWSWFAEVTDVAQIAGILSCFVDVKVKEQERYERPRSTDALVQRCAESLLTAYRRWEDLEHDVLQQQEVLTHVDDDLKFELMDWTMRWFRCTDEVECRIFLFDLHSILGVSVGDFNKAILKISTIVKELSGMAESHGQLGCLHLLSQMDAGLLKYVATSQSLYV
jgi:superfamily II RNA helicase